MLHLEWIRQTLDNAIINGEYRVYEGSCNEQIDATGRWEPVYYKQGVCPASILCLGDYADGSIHTRAQEKLGVSPNWLSSFISAFDGRSQSSTDEWEAWEMGCYFRAKFLFKEAQEWNDSRNKTNDGDFRDSLYEDDDEEPMT